MSERLVLVRLPEQLAWRLEEEADLLHLSVSELITDYLEFEFDD